MPALERIIGSEIQADGPISLSRFMQTCLTHSKHGYYTIQDSIGKTGDFVTAPEISQLFGEMIGIWLLSMWELQGQRPQVNLIELGPGKGTLMADILRVSRQFPAFMDALQVHLVEVSPRLTALQKDVITNAECHWYTELNEVPHGFSYIIANEFFDALPIDQYVKTQTGWAELRVDHGENRFHVQRTAPRTNPDLDLIYPDTQTGSIIEPSAQRDDLAFMLGQRLRAHGGAALIVDYGTWSGTGDTFQALRNHQSVSPFENLGKADLTSHVDFKNIARLSGCDHRFTTQGEFLEYLGITERAEKLCQAVKEATAQRVIDGHRRLTHPDEMGRLFKVLALYSNTLTHIPGFGG